MYNCTIQKQFYIQHNKGWFSRYIALVLKNFCTVHTGWTNQLYYILHMYVMHYSNIYGPTYQAVLRWSAMHSR